jgi:hypothetical protein
MTGVQTTVRVGFKHGGRHHLGFEVKVKQEGDVYVFVYERSHRRMHVSYHKDGRVNHNSDRPNKSSVPIMWDFWGEMEPMTRKETPVKDIVGRQRVAVVGWATEDIEKAKLPEFTPQSEDIVLEPTTPTTGFSVNIISSGVPARDIGHLRHTVLSRHVIGTAPVIEIETFDWLAPQARAQREVTSLYTVTPSGGGWILDESEPFNTLEEAQNAVVARHGEPQVISNRRDGGINIYYRRVEDDPFEL